MLLCRATNLLDVGKLEEAWVVGQEVGLGLVEHLDGLLEDLPGLGLELLLRGAEDLLEDTDELGGELLDGGVGVLVEVVDVLKDGGVLLVILLERENVGNGGKSLGNEFVVRVLGHHAGDSASDVVSHAHLVDSQERLKLLPEVRVHGEGLACVGRVEDDETNGVSSVGLGQRIGVCQAADKSLAERLGEGGDGLADVLGDLSNGADSGGSVEILAGAGKSENGLLEDLPELTKAGTKSGSKTNNNVKSCVNDKPVVLRRAGINLGLLLLITEILLARVRSGNDKANNRDKLLEETVLASENGGTASLEGSGNVAVDVSDDGAIRLPNGHGSLLESLSHGDERGRRSVLGRKTSLPLDTGALLPDLEDTGVGAPEGGDGSLSASLVCVLGEGRNLLDGLLDVGLEVGTVARVGDDITKDIKSNLLLKSDSSHGTEIVKVIHVLDIIPVLVTAVGNGGVVLILGSLNLDTLTTDNDRTVAKLASVNARDLNLLLLKLERREQTLEDTGKEVVELLVVDLRQVRPQDKASLLEARVVEAESLLAGGHEVHDVRLESLRADGHGDAAQAVASGASEVERLLTLLDGDELAKRGHDVLEVRLERLLHGRSDGTDGGSGSGLDAKVLVVEETDHGANQVGTVLSHDLGVNTVTEGVKSTASAADDADVALVLENRRDDLLVVRGHLIGHLLSKVDQTNKRGVSDSGVGILEKRDDGREKRLELSRDEVGSTLSSVAESEHGSHTVLGVVVASEVGELLQKRNDSLSGRKLVGQSVDKANSSTGRRKILLVVIGVKLGDDVHGLDHELSSHVLHTLDLHASVTNALDEESKSLRSGILLGVDVSTKLNHEGEEISEVESKEGRVVGDERVEDLEDDLVALLILGLDSSLEDVNQARNEALHGLEGHFVLLRLDDHEDSTNSADNVDANLLALRVLNAGLEELEEIVCVVGKREDVLEEVLTLTVLHISADNAGDETGERVADTSGGLLEDTLQKVVAGKLSLVLGGLLPELGDQTKGLDRGELSDTGISMCEGDLDEGEKRLGLGVEVLLELGGNGLDLLSVGWRDERLASEFV
ncbi:unnamed protein product [Fusarium graminearum]|nr:unnamed protein product [Fusarium graminearum]